MRLDGELMQTRRTIVRMMRNYVNEYSMVDYNHVQELWGMQYLQFRFPKYQKIRFRFMCSPTYWRWARRNFDLRNMSLLIELGYGINYSKKMTTADCEKFIAQFGAKHKKAYNEIFPSNPIVELINKEYKQLVQT